jgi:N-acetylglucosamine kinase-like BadF-type ATPase
MKYSNEKVFKVSKDEELDTRIEFIKQRQFLEKTIINLKKRVNACAKKNDSYSKIMEENMILIEENNKLRQELKVNLKKYEEMESIYKRSKKHITSKQIKNNNTHQKLVATANTKSIEYPHKEHNNVNINNN